MKILRWILILLAFLVFIILLSLGIFRLWFNPQKLQTILIEQTKTRTGYELQMLEPIKMSWLPPKLIFPVLRVNDPNRPELKIQLKQMALYLDLDSLIQNQDQIQGKIFINQLNINRWQFTQVELFPKWVQGILEIRPVSAELYQGHLQGVVHGRHLTSLAPEWDANIQLTQLNVGQWQNQVAPSKQFGLQGQADVDTQLRTHGNASAQMISNLNGGLHLSVKQGLLVGVDIHYWLQVANNILAHQAPPSSKTQSRGTPFSSLTGDVDIRGGTAYTKNLQMVADSFFLSAQGELDLSKQTVDLHLWVKPRVNSHLDFVVPIIVSGDLAHPSVSLDLLEIDKWIAKKQVEKIKDRVQKEIDKLPEQAGNFFKNLLGH